MSEQFEFWFWVGAAAVSFLIMILAMLTVLSTWLSWMIVNIEGAGRKAFIGTHGSRNEVIMRPYPLKTERTTNLISPLVRPTAWVNPDRDESVFSLGFQPQGAPATQKSDDEAVAQIRISWSIPKWVPYYDIPGPGDHGEIPENLIYRVRYDDDRVVPEADRRAVEAAKLFDDLRVKALYPHPTRKLVPGCAAVALMNKYTEGEHLIRMLEFAIHHARMILGSLEVRTYMRVTSVETLPIDKIVIRGRIIKLADVQDLLKKAKNADPIPTRYKNKGELQQSLSAILTWAVQRELEPYGVYVNDVTVRQVTLPETLVEASRTKEAMVDRIKAMEVFTDAFGGQVKKVVETSGMDSTLAGFLVADALETESRPGVLGALMALIKSLRS